MNLIAIIFIVLVYIKHVIILYYSLLV